MIFEKLIKSLEKVKTIDDIDDTTVLDLMSNAIQLAHTSISWGIGTLPILGYYNFILI